MTTNLPGATILPMSWKVSCHNNKEPLMRIESGCEEALENKSSIFSGQSMRPSPIDAPPQHSFNLTPPR
jgi:hypothetical protein